MSAGSGAGSGWSTREAAADLLIRIELSGSLQAAAAASTSFNALTGSDRAFARAIASAALRGQGRLDAAIVAASNRALGRIKRSSLAHLRVGAAQLFMLGTPAHAAVSATVEAVRFGNAGNTGFVNAVLRRLAGSPELYADQDDMSVWPDWLAKIMRESLGADGAAAMARLHLQAPDLDLTVRSAPQRWAERLGGEAMPNGVRLRTATGALHKLEGYDAGAWWVQNAAAALAVPLLGDIAGKRVCDLCAAPGGKTAQLAAAGAEVTAVDISLPRLARLRDTLTRTGLSAQIVSGDARTWRPERPFDALLLDAPCSGLGVMRRHPEGVWQRPRDIAGHARRGGELLAAASEMLEVGGHAVFCVCTPVRAEGGDQIAKAVASGRWRRLPVRAVESLGFAYALTAEGDVLTAPPGNYPRLDPGVLTGDVFFMSRLCKLA